MPFKSISGGSRYSLVHAIVRTWQEFEREGQCSTNHSNPFIASNGSVIFGNYFRRTYTPDFCWQTLKALKRMVIAMHPDL